MIYRQTGTRYIPSAHIYFSFFYNDESSQINALYSHENITCQTFEKRIILCMFS